MKISQVGCACVAAGCLLTAQLLAADAPDRAAAPPVTTIEVSPGEGIEPEVTIMETDKGTVYEYSVDGRVYMVKIVPQAGPAYYLLDSNGDGRLDIRTSDIGDISIPQWVLFSW